MACYDRMIPNSAMLASRKHGVHELVTQCNARTLEQAKYRMRTEMGLSETSYSHESQHPIYGTGQGSMNSGNNGTYISSALMDCYDTKASSATYMNPDRSNVNTWSMIGFVDDNNGQVNSFEEAREKTNLQKLHHKARTNATIWANLLSITGGALELSKCSYHVMNWEFTMNGAPVLQACPEEFRTLHVKDAISGQEHTLEYMNPHKAHKTLGVYKEPAGIQTEQFRQLKQKSDAVTQFLWSVPLRREETRLFYNACYLPSIGYPLTSTYFEYDQLDKIQRKAMSIIVARCGYNRHTKKEVVYGPIEYGGADFYHLYRWQSYQQIKYFMRQIRANTPVGNMIRCSLAWIQWSVGVSFPILHQVTTSLPHIESKWVASIRSFLKEAQLTIQMDSDYIPSKQREADEYIMDLVLRSEKFSPAEIRKINYCRLFLQAVTISDLSMATGTELDNSKFRGTPSLMSSTTSTLTPHQENPSESTWRVWRKASTLWSNTKTGKLHHPLGYWLHTVQEQRQQHFAYRYNRGLWIRQNHGEALYRYHKVSPGHGYQSRNRTQDISRLPPTARPVDVELNEFRNWQIRPMSHPIVRKSVDTPSVAESFSSFVQTLQPWERQYLTHVSMRVDPHRICAEGLLTLRAVSDGSVLPNGESSFGWVVSNTNGELLANGMGPVSGSQPNSYRAEACGMLSLLLFLSRIAEFTSTTGQWEGVLATDSESLLNTLHGNEERNGTDTASIDLNGNEVTIDPMAPEWDVLIEIQAAKRKRPGIRLEYVKGHQDRTKPFASLPLMAQLNVEADQIANKYYTLRQPHHTQVIMSPRTRVHMVGTKGTITSNYEDVICLELGKPNLLKWMGERHKWDADTIEQINWNAHGKALKQCPKTRHTLIKMVHDILPTTAQQNKFDGGRRTCPLCQCQQEDTEHIVRCQHPTRVEWRKTFLEAIKDYCVESKTHHDLQRLLLNVLEQWVNGDEIAVNNEVYPEAIQLICAQQQTIGWGQLLRGRFGNGWGAFQTSHYQCHGQNQGEHSTHRTGVKWQSGLIKVIWEQWHQVWISRNQDVHGRDASGKRTAERRELRRQLDRIYSQRSLMDPRVQSLLLENVEALEEQPHHVTKNWLRINQAIFKASVRRVKTLALRGGGVRSIRTYFTATCNHSGNLIENDTGT